MVTVETIKEEIEGYSIEKDTIDVEFDDYILEMDKTDMQGLEITKENIAKVIFEKYRE